jgi:hypothetical protein
LKVLGQKIASEYGLLPELERDQVTLFKDLPDMYVQRPNYTRAGAALADKPDSNHQYDDGYRAKETITPRNRHMQDVLVYQTPTPPIKPNFLHHNMSPRTPTPPHLKGRKSQHIRRRQLVFQPQDDRKWPDKTVENAQLAQAARNRRGRKRYVELQGDAIMAQKEALELAQPQLTVCVRVEKSGQLFRVHASTTDDIRSLKSRLATMVQISAHKQQLFLLDSADEVRRRKDGQELLDTSTIAQLSAGVWRGGKERELFLLLTIDPAASYVFLPEWTPRSLYRISQSGSTVSSSSGSGNVLTRVDGSLSLTGAVRVGPLMHPHTGAYAIEFVLEKATHRMCFYVLGPVGGDDEPPLPPADDTPEANELQQPLPLQMASLNPYRADAFGARMFTSAFGVQVTTPGQVWRDHPHSIPNSTSLKRGDTVRIEYDTNTNTVSAWFGSVNYARRLQIFADQAKDVSRGPLCFMLDLRGADSVRVLPPVG